VAALYAYVRLSLAVQGGGMGTLKMRDWKMRDWKIRDQETYGTPRVA